jgi:hypothetical protein
MNRKLIFPLVLMLVLVMAAPAGAAQLGANGNNFAASFNTQDGLLPASSAYVRGDLTAFEILAKSSQKMMEANSYKTSSRIDMTLDMTAQAAGQIPQAMSMQASSTGDCWTQINPMLLYMKQNTTVNIPNMGNVPSTQMEMLMNESGVYTYIPETGWTKMSLQGLNMQELMKQSSMQNPEAIMQQIKALGMSVNLADDQEKNGQKYWVINVATGSTTAKSDFLKQFCDSLEIPASPDMDKIMAGISLDLSYQMWINQNTYYTDYMDLQGKLGLNMDIPDASAPGHLNMTMTIKGNCTMSGYGQTFTVPDVSKAVDISTIK